VGAHPTQVIIFHWDMGGHDTLLNKKDKYGFVFK
jgi:hypothetical protein